MFLRTCTQQIQSPIQTVPEQIIYPKVIYTPIRLPKNLQGIESDLLRDEDTHPIRQSALLTHELRVDQVENGVFFPIQDGVVALFCWIRRVVDFAVPFEHGVQVVDGDAEDDAGNIWYLFSSNKLSACIGSSLNLEYLVSFDCKHPQIFLEIEVAPISHVSGLVSFASSGGRIGFSCDLSSP